MDNASACEAANNRLSAVAAANVCFFMISPFIG